MIIRYEDRTLADLEAVAVECRKNGYYRAPSTIRKHCTPVAKDPDTGRNLYDLEAAREILRDVATREPHSRRASLDKRRPCSAPS